MRSRGFTLVEILIAMAVFLVGIVAILALFPVGINSSRISTDQSVAAALAESLDDALTLALRQYDGVAGAAADQVHFYHDGLGATGHAQFDLPPLETWFGTIDTTATSYLANGRSTPTWYPGGVETAPPATLASITTAGKSGNMAALVGTTDKDFPDPLGQYSFRFMCHEYKNPNDKDGDADENPVGPLIDPDGPSEDVGFGGGGAGNGRLDPAEDANWNGVLDVGPPSEDTNTDGILNGGFPEDANGNGLLDGVLPPQPQFYANNGVEAEVVDKLFQFTLYVYRGWVPEDHSGDLESFQVWTQGVPAAPATPLDSNGNASTYSWQDQLKHSKMVESFEFTVYAQGARQAD